MDWSQHNLLYSIILIQNFDELLLHLSKRQHCLLFSRGFLTGTLVKTLLPISVTPVWTASHGDPFLVVVAASGSRGPIRHRLPCVAVPSLSAACVLQPQECFQ